MNYKKIKRKTIDNCNICGKLSKLTWDHVPPKALLEKPNVYVNTIGQQLPSESKYIKHYQSGIKYRTICEECNNVRVGINDIELKKFKEEVKSNLDVLNEANKLGIITDQTFAINIKINRVLRAVCGHFLAMKSQFDEKVIIDKDMRTFLMDETKKIQGVHVYSWIYPYSTIVNLRDAVVKGRLEKTHPQGMVSVMSMYPLAFLISSHDEMNCCLDDLSAYSTENIDDEVSILLHLNTMMCSGTQMFKPLNWPFDFQNDETGILFAIGNNEMMHESRLGITR